MSGDEDADRSARRDSPAEEPDSAALTEEDKRSAERAREFLRREYERTKDLPPLDLAHPDKFVGPFPGYDEDGTPQRPLSREEREHNARVRREAREELERDRQTRDTDRAGGGEADGERS